MPALDAVLFLTPRNSLVDIVQSVGRVMRKAPGKQFGYIILPIGIPSGMAPEEALRDNKRYKVVWQVLQALRAHDERFHAMVNQIELNKRKHRRLDHRSTSPRDRTSRRRGDRAARAAAEQLALDFDFDGFRDAIYAKIVAEGRRAPLLGDWAKDVADIADAPHHPHQRRCSTTRTRRRRKEFAALPRRAARQPQRAASPPTTRSRCSPSTSSPGRSSTRCSRATTSPRTTRSPRRWSACSPRSTSTTSTPRTAPSRSSTTRSDAASRASTTPRASSGSSSSSTTSSSPPPSRRPSTSSASSTRRSRSSTSSCAPPTRCCARSSARASPTRACTSSTAFTGTGTFIVRLLQSGLIEPARPGPQVRRGAARQRDPPARLLHRRGQHRDHLSRAPGQRRRRSSRRGLRAVPRPRPHRHLPVLRGRRPRRPRHLPREQRAPRALKKLPDHGHRRQPAVLRRARTRPTTTTRTRSTRRSTRRSQRPTPSARPRRCKNSLYDSYIRAIKWATLRIQDRGVVAFVTNGGFLDANTADGMRKTPGRGVLVDLRVQPARQPAHRWRAVAARRAARSSAAAAGRPSRSPCWSRTPTQHGPGHDPLHRHRRLPDRASRSSRGCRRREQSAGLDAVVDRTQRARRLAQPATRRLRHVRCRSATRRQCRSSARTSDGLETNRDAWVYNFGRQRRDSNVSATDRRLQREVDAAVARRRGTDRPDRDQLDRRTSDATSSAAVATTFDPDAIVVGARTGRSASSGSTSTAALNDTSWPDAATLPDAGASATSASTSRVSARRTPFCVLTMTDAASGPARAATRGQFFPRWRYEPVDDEDGLDLGGDGEVVDGYRRIDNITDEALSRFAAAYGDDWTQGRHLLLRLRAAALPGLPRDLRGRPEEDAAADPAGARTATRAFAEAGRQLSRAAPGLRVGDAVPARRARRGRRADGDARTTSTRSATRRCVRQADRRAEGSGERHDRSVIHYNDRITLSGIPEEAYRYSSARARRSSGSSTATRSRPTRPPASSTTPTTGPGRSATRATSSTCSPGS